MLNSVYKIKNSKLTKLNALLNKMRKVIVAYSGGLDSAFLLKTATEVLGRENVLAVTAVSATYPKSERLFAKKLARAVGARRQTIRTDELEDPKFVSNPVDRCYYCKKGLFKRLERIRRERGMYFVVDGANRDDLSDIRHGKRAAREFGVRSPLLEAGFTKSDIRRFSRMIGLPTWNKPSMACLASRMPYNSRITRAGLDKIEKAESCLGGLGFGQVRVRLHNSTARIELCGKDIEKAVRLRRRITGMLRKLGFVYVTLDLVGYRTGSMHEG